MNKLFTEIKFFIVTFVIILFTIMYVAFVITIGWIITFTTKVKVNEMWKRLYFMWLIIINHYKKLFSGVGLNIPNFKIKRPKLSLPDIDISIDTEDFALMFLLLWDGLYILWLFYALINTIIVALTYTVIYYNPVASDVETKTEIVKQVFIPTDADKQEIELCPCTSSFKLAKSVLDGNSFKNIALLENSTGELKYSNDYVIDFEDNSFQKRNSQNIKTIEFVKEGKYRIEWVGNTVFEINSYQAFQVLDDPYFTYMLNDNGELYLIQTEKIKKINKDEF